MVQNKIIDNEEIISTYAEVALGIHPEVKRSGGILLTVEDLLTIKFYVEFGFGLPDRLHEVEKYLGYRTIGIAGLEPRDIQELFRKIKINVSKWDGIEAGLLTQNRDIETFSPNIITVGNDIIKCIDNMPVIQRMKKIEENGVIPPGMLFDFNSMDNEVATELVSWLEDLKSEVETRRRETLNLKNKITDFNQEISDVLEPSIRRKRDLIRNNSLNA
ncbi:hypothetical protein I8748_27600 [Nostoc sp. CENA67]|uniref:Uncharacterized protein n=1 Tax=Amazonocrinis nigriterrae CENA67 TaxID=2794033 RepID=A0A8J7HUB6_9NOST|nr:hypothetical protein [Amazonocrinis nigriterrae]MBH8565887.1 hypothetical protein [Amazonocrinis nigriterrae CENA67]